MIHESCNDTGDLSLVGPAVFKTLVQYLPLDTVKKCRLVCHRWNKLFLNHLNFQINMSDGVIDFLSQLHEPLHHNLSVNHIIVHDMSPLSYRKLISPPRNHLKLRIANRKNVKKLTFFEGSTPEWKRKLMAAFRWINELYFSPHTFPVFPRGTAFEHLELLEVNLVKRSENNELIEFFKCAEFQSLRRLKLGFCCRKDYWTYAHAHYFVGKHHGALKFLRLCVDFLPGFDSKSSENFDVTVFKEDSDSLLAEMVTACESSEDYQHYVENLEKLSLESLSMDFSPHEGRPPWTLSLKLVQSQKNLRKFRMLVNSHDLSWLLHEVVNSNCKSIEKISVPIKMTFDCALLRNCDQLRSFSVGENFNFIHPFLLTPSTQRGCLTNFDMFPISSLLKTVCIGVPLGKQDILWLSSHVPCSKFMARGVPGEFFTKQDVELILAQRQNFKKLMMLIAINADQRHRLLTYLWSFRELIVLYFFDHTISGLTEFKVQITKFRIAPFKQLQDTLNRGDSDYDIDSSFV